MARFDEHIGKHDHASAAIDALESGQHVAPPLVEIVVGTDRNRLDLLLRSDHVLERRAELVSELAMCDDDDADHVSP